MPIDDEIDPDQDGLDPNIREALRGRNQLARDKAAAEERNAQLERELAFTKAGIPDTPLVAALAKTYEGDNDPASVKAYFESLGVELTSTSAGTPSAGSQAPPAPQGATEEELAAQRRVSQVGSGTEGDGSIDFADAIKSADSQEAVMALINSAPEGSGIGTVAIT